MRVFYATSAMFAALTLATAVLKVDLVADDTAGGAERTVADGEVGIVVLQDGGVLEGRITRAANWLIVSRAGGEMQVAQARVMLVCRSLEEAYEYRRQRLSEPKADPHLSLADWCLRYNLFADAGRELADARRLDPDHPRVALLERRLAKAIAQPAAKTGAASAAKAQTRAAGPTSPASAIAGDLPAGVVERFTRKVQPVLVNSCTMSSCHQPGGPHSFQLDRAILRGEANRRTTMHNLQATLALVDREHPEKSLLLTIPRRTHGGMAGPIFGPRQEQAFKHVADWVALVAPPAPADEAASSDEKDAASMPPEKNATAIPVVSPPPPVSKRNRSATAMEASAANPLEEAPQTPSGQASPLTPTAAIDGEAPPTLRKPHRLQYGARLESWRPRDPFDPEIFNRLQQTRKRAVAEAAQSTAADKH